MTVPWSPSLLDSFHWNLAMICVFVKGLYIVVLWSRGMRQNHPLVLVWRRKSFICLQVSIIILFLQRTTLANVAAFCSIFLTADRALFKKYHCIASNFFDFKSFIKKWYGGEKDGSRFHPKTFREVSHNLKNIGVPVFIWVDLKSRIY